MVTSKPQRISTACGFSQVIRFSLKVEVLVYPGRIASLDKTILCLGSALRSGKTMNGLS
jgi:hypothetical protein